MIDWAADWFAVRLIRWSGQEVDEDTLAYRLALWLNTALIILFTVLVSVFTGTLRESLLTLVLIGLLRSVLGGVHLPNLDICAVFTVGLAIAIPQISHLPSYVLTFISLASLIIIYLKFPQSWRPARKWPFLIGMFVLDVALNYGVLTLCILVQALSLLPSASTERRD